MGVLRGSCLCGGVAYEIRGPLRDVVDCHCSQCRKATGSAFRTRAAVRSADFRWTRGEALVTRYESSPGNQRSFCSRCGSTLGSFFPERPDEIGLPLGTLDDDPGLRPGAHVFVGSRAPWYEINDDRPRFETLPPGNHDRVDTLLDAWLPEWDVRERYEVLVAAGARETWDAVGALDLRRSRVVRTLFRLRGLPREALRLEAFERMGFVRLAEAEGREWVLGAVGRFWTPRGGFVACTPQAFRAFREPGYARVAWGFRLEPRGPSATQLATETRVQATDPRSRRRFRPYWLAVGPFSGWIRREMLRVVKADAEARCARAPGRAHDGPSSADAGASR